MTQPQFKQAQGNNALRVTISGSYKKVGDGEIIDFEDVSGVMPLVEEPFAIAAARRRYAYTWIKEALDKEGERKYQKPIGHIREVHIDDIKEIANEFSYVGKGIKEMDEHELQDFAVEKGIREIPLTRRRSGLSVREMRKRTYLQYANRVLGWKIDMNDPAQNNYAKWNDIIPNPIQKAAPVRQETSEEAFSGQKGEDSQPQHMAPQKAPEPTAPHMVNPDIPAEEEVKPKVVYQEEKQPLSVTSDTELNRIKKIADDNGISYDWDVELNDLMDTLTDAGVSLST